MTPFCESLIARLLSEFTAMIDSVLEAGA